MLLLRLNSISLGFGGPSLLDDVNLEIKKGDRVCLIGRNGAGKSTLLRLIAGELEADRGSREERRSLSIARLEQEIPAGISGTVFEVVSKSLGDLSGLAKRYHEASLELAAAGNDDSLRKLTDLQHALESAGGWQIEQRVETVISRLSLDPDAKFTELSGGLQRRVLLAGALALDPDLLLLDEPTNHLDLESIEWLEHFLLKFGGALVFVTHDRTFLRNLANRIWELDRGALSDWPGDFDNFLRRKEEMLHSEEKGNERFDKRLVQEEAWIRQGIQARRTRNQGRVRALLAMRQERRRRREVEGSAKLGIVEAKRSGKLVIEADSVSYCWQDSPVISGFSTLVLRGDKVGLIGRNGVGKTTLLNILLGKLSPDSGHVRLGTGLEVAYFDQHRTLLDPGKSVLDNMTDEVNSPVTAGGTRNVIGYLKDFLFTPARMRMPVSALSGGERNRLLLARLFAKPANVLVMDEPTNDLDMETLELLEERLVGYRGTLLLVSHDRSFLNNVVTSCLVFEGEGRVSEYVGGYDDWLAQRPVDTNAVTNERTNQVKARDRTKPAPERRQRKLGYKEQRELDSLPKTIENLEQEQSEIRKEMSDPAFFRQDGGHIADTNRRLAALDEALEEAYSRWEELEARGE